jgi:hypothetical protein
VWDVRRFLHLDLDNELAPGGCSAAYGCTKFEEKRPGRSRFSWPVCKLGEPSHFLQQLQHFNSRCHALARSACCKSRAMNTSAKRRHIKGPDAFLFDFFT